MRNYTGIIIVLVMAGLVACSQETEKKIMTVKGLIPAAELGRTLSHEHVLVDFIGADSTGYHRWNKNEVVDKVMPYLSEIRKLNVDALVECTPAFLGRDPWILTTLSENSGLHLITNTGYYGAHQNRFLPEPFYRKEASDIAAIWVDEFENGIEGSGVRPGFIKIAVDGDNKLSEDHRKIITAAALAHQKTGLVIASHTGPDGPAFEQIAVLQDYNIAPSSFIWVHAQNGSLEGNIKAAKMGAWVSLDNVDARRVPGSDFNVSWYANRIKALKEAGFLHRILISHDAGWYKPGEENGGGFRSFTAIFSELLPLLRNMGFSQRELDQIIVDNPREAFSIRKTS